MKINSETTLNFTRDIKLQDPTVTRIKRDQKIPVIWFVANIGGILGLCMGCSLVTVFEVGHHVILVFLRTGKKGISTVKSTFTTGWVFMHCSHSPFDLLLSELHLLADASNHEPRERKDSAHSHCTAGNHENNKLAIYCFRDCQCSGSGLNLFFP